MIEAINNMKRNTNSNVPRNDNNLVTLPRTTEEFDTNVQVELQKRKRLHDQIYQAKSLSSYCQSLLNTKIHYLQNFELKLTLQHPYKEKK